MTPSALIDADRHLPYQTSHHLVGTDLDATLVDREMADNPLCEAQQHRRVGRTVLAVVKTKLVGRAFRIGLVQKRADIGLIRITDPDMRNQDEVGHLSAFPAMTEDSSSGLRDGGLGKTPITVIARSEATKQSRVEHSALDCVASLAMTEDGVSLEALPTSQAPESTRSSPLRRRPC
ncbi:MAG: hypothetical protein E6699_20225 [Bradyrhizobium sp.]|nr:MULTISPECIES: hypothetical protein [Bradyrhizobium]MDU1493923.1 hypothetical protein [Bradyrhizobium sp.]MDU1544081.1 hypothetical protein [Bradyrhizobium sp.]MDU3129808.1 hypothetical protein [Bradyrhizobium sp.]MDU3225191.1 hypothetical protein [Bradyrhizobium sp.]MDU6187787.1 hypothetical protein [Bradyrhizobium sp.]